MFDVIIPARNAEATVSAVVSAFRACRKIERILVVVDAATTDRTADAARSAGAIDLHGPFHNSKGHNVTYALRFATTKQIIFSDADYEGLSRWHVARMCLHPKVNVQLIGVPDVPPNLPPSLEWTWWQMSGFRRVPSLVARFTEFHGYLMETQINEICARVSVPTMKTNLTGLKSPFRMEGQRKQERDRDYEWGIRNGWLPKPSDRSEPN